MHHATRALVGDVEQQPDAGQHPAARRRLGVQLTVEDPLRPAERRLVARALEAVQVGLLDEHRLDVDHGHGAEHLFRLGALHHAGLDVEARALHGQADDVRALASGAVDALGRHLLLDVRLRHELVELELVLLRRHLHDCRQERLRRDEPRDPRDLRDVHRVAAPLLDLMQPAVQVEEPS